MITPSVVHRWLSVWPGGHPIWRDPGAQPPEATTALGVVAAPRFRARRGHAAGKVFIEAWGLRRHMGCGRASLILLFWPVTVGLMVLREPCVHLPLERGTFTAASKELTAELLF